jgi:ribosomal protein L16 Arg81 hydroxylase
MTNDLLEWARSEVFRSHWQQRSLYRPAGAAGAVLPLEVDSLVTDLSRPRASSALMIQAGFKDRSGQHRQIRITGDQVEPLLKGGLTIQVNHLETEQPALKQTIEQLKSALAIPGEGDAALFLSEVGAGYGLHFDNLEMWVVQLEGSKRWRYSQRPAQAFPGSPVVWDNLSAEGRLSPRLRPPDACDMAEAVLRPGDILYLPGGCWHTAQAEALSIHLSVSFSYHSFSRLLVEGLLRPLFAAHPDWRALPPLPSAAEAEASAYLRARLQELRALLDDPQAVQALERRWRAISMFDDRADG